MNDADKFLRRFDRILAIISKQPGITAAQLQRATASISVDDRAEIIQSLLDDGEIRIEVIKQHKLGRRLTRYWPTPECRKSQDEDAIAELEKAYQERQRRNKMAESRRRFREQLAKVTGDERSDATA
jgi:hypothetical protein